MSTSDRIDSYVWRISLVVIVGAIMSILDTTIVNVALATLGHELHSPISQIQWVVTGYMLSLAAVIPNPAWRLLAALRTLRNDAGRILIPLLRRDRPAVGRCPGPPCPQRR